MLDRLLGFKIHEYLHPLGLLILAFGLPMNKVLMSIGTIWLISNLILKADFKSYWKNVKGSVVFWVICSIFLMHVIGLFYTSDFNYAFRDLNTKLPLFVIAPVLIAYPIQKRFINFILYGFLLSLLITSLINYSFLFHHRNLNYREFSLFGSHIRYSLLVVMGIGVSIYLIQKNRKIGWLWSIFICWCCFYTSVSQVSSGYVALFFLITALVFYLILKIKNKRIKVLSFLVLTAFILIGTQQLYRYLIPTQPLYEFSSLATKSAGGEIYFHDTTNLLFENGHHVMSNIARKELYKAWGNRSNLSLSGESLTGGSLHSILLRYMTSKGLKKDSVGMSKMTNSDIHHVENGKTSIDYTHSKPRALLANVKNEMFHYYVGGDPDGNSLLQRFEHWKVGTSIIRDHWLFGVGTGDVQTVFDKKYTALHTELNKSNWNRAHNQFMTFWITFGVLGFVIFTVFWLFFVGQTFYYQNLLGFLFVAIAISSFLAEDTIETQQGVTFIGLFIGISCLINRYNSQKTLN